MTANQTTSNHKYCLLTNQRKNQNLLFEHMIRQMYQALLPLACDEQNISCVIISFVLHQAVWGVPPASHDEQNIKLRDYLIHVTSSCVKCVTHQLWRTKYKAAWLFLLRYIKLFGCATHQLWWTKYSAVWLFLLRYIKLFRCATHQLWWTKY